VTGSIAPPPARLYEFSGAASGAIRQNIDIESFSREIGLALPPVSILQAEFSLTQVRERPLHGWMFFE